MLKESKTKKQPQPDDDMDVGMDDLNGFFANVSTQQPGKPKIEEPATRKPATEEPPPAPKKKKQKSLLTRKPGIYLSEKVDDRLDREWRNQRQRPRKSKSMIVEEILRQYWKLPPIKE